MACLKNVDKGVGCLGMLQHGIMGFCRTRGSFTLSNLCCRQAGYLGWDQSLSKSVLEETCCPGIDHQLHLVFPFSQTSFHQHTNGLRYCCPVIYRSNTVRHTTWALLLFSVACLSTSFCEGRISKCRCGLAAFSLYEDLSLQAPLWPAL